MWLRGEIIALRSIGVKLHLDSLRYNGPSKSLEQYGMSDIWG